MNNYQHIIFDLGGVLIELGKMPIPESYFGNGNWVTLKEWFSSPIAHEFEQGKVSAEFLASKFIDQFELNISIDVFIELFSLWPQRVNPGAKELLIELAKKYQLSVLSNCNVIHWPLMDNKFHILRYFHNKFSSHLIGLTKPDISIYEHVLEKLNTSPSSVLFFDDNQKNIGAANSIGIKSVLVNGTQEIKKYLYNNNLM